MHLFSPSILVALFHAFSALAADDSKSGKPCTVTSPNHNTYYDLRKLAVLPLEEGEKKHKDDREESWHAKGYDYGANFTINFCAPVVEELKSVVGVEEKLWKNVSAFYEKEGKTYSIGQLSTTPIFRGRKLVLTYENGSPCGGSREKRSSDDDDRKDDKDKDDEDEDEPKKGSDRKRRKSTIFSFLCDKDTYDPSKPKVSVSFVAASSDECTYVFEARSPLSCGGASQNEQAVGPGGVFGIIALIALAVYILGGVAYQRTVMHQRGWRQLPNYSMWANIGSFCKDILIILFSSCSRLFPRRRGYNQLPTYSSRGRGSSRDDENRLIDQLDEEWDD